MKQLRVLALMHPELVPPGCRSTVGRETVSAGRPSATCLRTLRELGHEVAPLGVQDELQPIRDAVETFKPDVVFNLLEEFHGNVLYDQNVVSLPRAASRAVHRLQSARADHLPREGAGEEAARLPSHPGAGVPRVPAGAQACGVPRSSPSR